MFHHGCWCFRKKKKRIRKCSCSLSRPAQRRKTIFIPAIKSADNTLSSRLPFLPKNQVISCNLRKGLGVAEPQRYSARKPVRCVSLNRIFQTTLAYLSHPRCWKNGSSNYVVALKVIFLIDISQNWYFQTTSLPLPDEKKTFISLLIVQRYERILPITVIYTRVYFSIFLSKNYNRQWIILVIFNRNIIMHPYSSRIIVILL